MAVVGGRRVGALVGGELAGLRFRVDVRFVRLRSNEDEDEDDPGADVHCDDGRDVGMLMSWAAATSMIVK